MCTVLQHTVVFSCEGQACVHLCKSVVGLFTMVWSNKIRATNLSLCWRSKDCRSFWVLVESTFIIFSPALRFGQPGLHKVRQNVLPAAIYQSFSLCLCHSLWMAFVLMFIPLYLSICIYVRARIVMFPIVLSSWSHSYFMLYFSPHSCCHFFFAQSFQFLCPMHFLPKSSLMVSDCDHLLSWLNWDPLDCQAQLCNWTRARLASWWAPSFAWYSPHLLLPWKLK